MRLDLFVKIMYQSNTKILYVGVKQSVLLVLFCAWPVASPNIL